MPLFVLRYGGRVIDLPLGEFRVGRSSECNLVLNDAAVSRHHAAFVVSPDKVVLRDLQSRNGVLLNGTKVKDQAVVRENDVVLVATHEMKIEVRRIDPRLARQETIPDISALAPGFRAVTVPDLAAASPSAQQGDKADSATLYVSSRVLLVDVVNKALTLGRMSEAERVLRTVFDEIDRGAQRGVPIAAETLRKVTECALRVTEQSKSGEWLDRVFEVHTSARRLLEADTIEALHGIVRRVRYQAGPSFRAYLDSMQRRSRSLSVAERFLLQRLQGLGSVIGA